MADEFGAADASRQERQGALAAQGGGWGGSFPAANFSGDDGGGGGGGVSSLTADFQRGMDFSGSGDAPTLSAADPIAYVGSGSGQPTIAAKPVTGTPAQRAAQQGVPRPRARAPGGHRGPAEQDAAAAIRAGRAEVRLGCLVYSRVPAGRYFWLC